MNREQPTIRDLLHALADGQLDYAQSRQVLAQVERNPDLQKELCDIQRIKHLVKSAYPLMESPSHRPARPRFPALRHAASYALAIGLAFVAGAASQHYLAAPKAEGVALDTSTASDNRYIVFLDSREPAKLAKALDKAEKLATEVEASGGGVYVVTSAEGLDLVRLGTTPYEGRVFQMSQKYPHLRFVACNNTLYAYRQRDELVDLVEGTEVAPSAVEFVVKHLRDGWRYIAI